MQVKVLSVKNPFAYLIRNGSAGSAKQKALRRAIGKAGGGLQVKAFGKWL